MLKRIALILQTQNLTVSQFADRIGVQRSALSHVLGGRNNPSLDFVTKILRTFPEIRSQWLLFGEGKMYDAMAEVRPAEKPVVEEPVTAVGTVSEPVAEAPADVLAVPDAKAEMSPMAAAEMPVPAAEILPAAAADMPSAAEMPTEMPVSAPEMPTERPADAPRPDALPDMAGFAPVQATDSRLVKVVFFYSDGRFEEYERR